MVKMISGDYAPIKSTMEHDGSEYTYTARETTNKRIIYSDDKLTWAPVFSIVGAKVKYTPGKFNKLFVEYQDTDDAFFQAFWEFVSTMNPDVENFIRPINGLSLKINENLKDEAAKFKKGDYVDVIIKYNDVWQVGSKQYVSLVIHNIKKSKYLPVETRYEFDDDDKIDLDGVN
jgi:hypothetical protein